MNERPSPYNLDEAERAMHDPDRNRNYETLRDSGCSHDLATALLGMGDEFSRLKAELAAIKARRCETCRHCKQWTTSDGEPRAACTRLSDAHKVIEFVVPERDGCSRWQDKEAADG